MAKGHCQIRTPTISQPQENPKTVAKHISNPYQISQNNNNKIAKQKGIGKVEKPKLSIHRLKAKNEVSTETNTIEPVLYDQNY